MAYVLIVDDDEEFAIAAAIVLRAEGHEVATKTETSAAMTAMQVRRPDLVILDVMFPEDDFAGFELARAMCKSRDLSRDSHPDADRGQPEARDAPGHARHR